MTCEPSEFFARVEQEAGFHVSVQRTDGQDCVLQFEELDTPDFDALFALRRECGIPREDLIEACLSAGRVDEFCSIVDVSGMVCIPEIH